MDINPVDVYEGLFLKATTQKQKNLKIIHEICAELHKIHSRDFSLATIGRMSEARGGVATKTFYNKTSDDFKLLIRAWESFSHPKKGSIKSKTQDVSYSNSDLLKKIDDFVLRSLFGEIIAERDRLRGEIRILKANSEFTIDRRPLPGHVKITQEGQVIQVLNSTGLSDTEKQALSQAISAQHFVDEGWSEGPHGEILNANGRKIFDIGFVNAVKKCLLD